MTTRNSYVGVVAAFAAISCIFANSTGARTVEYPLLATLTSISPTHAMEGQLVTISGSYLESTKHVQFATVTADSVSVDPAGTWVRAVVPAGVPTGPVDITLDVLGNSHSIGPITIQPGSVPPEANPQPSAHSAPTVGAPVPVVVVAPRITKFTPTAGKTGTKVTINGVAFTGATWLKFGGLTAKFTVTSANWIIATVPKHAHSGKITVHTKAGTAVSSMPFKG